ncbi:Undecaprenyl-phosphate galactose phosphotransferase [Paenibacillus vortex V453]|jgi:lipopolysaccharide/colanic/teichoic acid biosynthesis glycosyltransferase|uniref:Multidrug MFS transporter n=4 Tax=Paenibacillus TaxID=44249 RepID=A0A163GZT1_9BACL|nr:MULTISPECIES: sugar transferase [Paenibacillus]ANA79280.1 multidrug MFS transporter [Paenibacillus glucanolyticus]AVV56778.1 sugar transferase [Paenibacillus glucanolyticus]AWP25945.1 multidrug MFS transporter [Paenibacillus sp. Cedars]EFU38626.1 Undecaprenyl-phosphate galactose phosphotransferase [Paenibacillus vortex V453]ETT37921.1 Undecaprenyl-phosphate galactose phosphotransferase [Paenibacillus sp. FSL R5-808]
MNVETTIETRTLESVVAEEYPMMTGVHLVPAKPHIGYSRLKRVGDAILSAVGLILLLPLFMIIFLCMKFENPHGPMFFSQTRVGKNGRIFKMYKIRSMVVNAEELQQKLIHLNEIEGAMFKMKNDPRITKVGRILRRTSLDELPQLWNVLRGEMSLVGPRPPLPTEVESYTPYDMQRLSVVPGCTGLWQVSGRNALGFHEMVELDLQYIREQSTTQDIRIMLKTVRVFLGSKDAF